MHFDAKAARALAHRNQGLHGCLADMKKAVLQAAQAGEMSAVVALPETVNAVAGTSTNNAVFLIGHLEASGLGTWSEAVRQAVRAGYAAAPSWTQAAQVPAYDGVLLSWSLCDDIADAAVMLMPARRAYETSRVALAHALWVEQQREPIRRAASQGKVSCTVWDALPPADAGWDRRRALLQHAGFSTELIATERGADLVIRW